MKPYKKVLINSLVNLGDVVLSTSAAALLKKTDPEIQITMLVRPFAREVVENNPVVDQVLVFDYKAKQKSWKTMYDMLFVIKKEHFDLCISLDRKLRPAILTWLARIPVRLVPEKIFDNKKSRIDWLYTNVIPITYDFEHTLQAHNFQEVVRGFFRTEAYEKPAMGRPSAENTARADKLLAALPAGRRQIALCVKGSFPLKTWPKQYFLQLMTRLEKEYAAAFFIVGGAADSAYAEEFVKESPVPVTNFCGKTSLKDLVPLFQKTDLLITVDTGAMHIAATTEIPIMAMFGCGIPERWPPLTEKSRIVTVQEPCAPCHIPPEACPSWPQPQCQWKITPEMVFEKCREFL